MTLFNTKQLNQAETAQSILDEYNSNQILARSILTGLHEENPDRFEDAIWYDLEMLRRQKELDGKPYRDPNLYEELLNKLQQLNDNLTFIENDYRKIEKPIKTLRNICFQYLQANSLEEDEKIIDKIKQNLDLRLLSIFENEDYKKMAQYIKTEFQETSKNQNYINDNDEKKGFRFKNFSYQRAFDFETRLLLKNLTDYSSSSIYKNMKIKKQQAISSSNLLYPEIIDELKHIEQTDKSKKIDFTSKQSAQITLTDYIKYRNIKNLIHKYCKKIFLDHQRTNSQEVIAIESTYGYFTGYKIKRHPDSLKKIIYPSIKDFEKKFSEDKRIYEEDKVISLPSSWSYIFSDIPTGLFSGRKGNIAFALITPDKNIATVENSYEDLQFSDLSIFENDRVSIQTMPVEEIFNQKQRQRNQAITSELPSSIDPWFDKEKQLSGHTESLIYGLPAGIIVRTGYEDVALEARIRYSEAGLMNVNAPFFYYDPTLEKSISLRHVSDEEIIKKAQEIFSDQKIVRLKYQVRTNSPSINQTSSQDSQTNYQQRPNELKPRGIYDLRNAQELDEGNKTSSASL